MWVAAFSHGCSLQLWLQAMDELWAADGVVACTHPGHSPLTGRAAAACESMGMGDSVHATCMHVHVHVHVHMHMHMMHMHTRRVRGAACGEGVSASGRQ